MEAPEAFTRQILPDVSRTFALNIPVLPAPLDLVVTVAYLLCRIADTIEDESAAEISIRAELFTELAALVALPDGWQDRSDTFTARARPLLRATTPAAEIRLLDNTRMVLQALANLPTWTHGHVARCLATMTRGMAEVSRQQPTTRGVPDVESLMTYCYYVAGTVGEMLTGLFIEYSDGARAIANVLEPRARAFGRTLQLTNILKDVREDLDRGICWLPHDRLAAHGLTVSSLAQPECRDQAVALLDELVGVAKAEADRAFEYTLALPASEPGMRLFCLWPLFFAVLTLQELEGNPAVFDPAPVKLSRETIRSVMVATKDNVASDAALRVMYRNLARTKRAA